MEGAKGTLQSRLDAVFGGLTRGAGEEKQWKPSTEQIFRVGAPILDQQPGSSDEEAEYEERARREVVPGLAMDLAAEDSPDAEGFRPSTAFCRALDREEEYNDVDELATGTYRSGGRGRDGLPPRNTEVLDDNIWEQRIAQQEALRHGREGEGAVAAEPVGEPAAAPGQVAAMDTDAHEGPAADGAGEGAAEGKPAAVLGGQRGRPRASSSGSELSERASEGGEGAGLPRPALAAGGARLKGGSPKRVRFQGVPEPWVPPHRRQGFVSRDLGSAPPTEELAEAAGRNGAGAQRRQRGIAQSRVPDHVKHPERYTCYTLDEPLVVGGGLGQLGAEGRSQQEQAAASAAAEARAGSQPGEPERWRGEVGSGQVQFRPKARAPPAGAVSNAGAAAAPAPAVRLASLVEEAAEEEREPAHKTDEGEQLAEGHGSDAEMQDAPAAAAAQQGGQFRAPRSGRAGRGYRSKAAGEEEKG